MSKEISRIKSMVARHKNQRRRLGRQLKKAQRCLAGASLEALKLNFQSEVTSLEEQLEEMYEKEERAKKQLRQAEINYHTNQKGALVHHPFENIKEMV
jgi:hypothetical protein